MMVKSAITVFLSVLHQPHLLAHSHTNNNSKIHLMRGQAYIWKKKKMCKKVFLT